MAPISFELIKRHLSYALECDSKVHTLQHEIAQLENKKDILRQYVVDATIEGKEIYLNVIRWLSDANKAIKEAKEVVQQREETKKCFAGMCPNLKTLYKFSKIVEKNALVIDKLYKEEGLDTISFDPDIELIVETSMFSSELLPSRVLVLNQIMDALKDPSLNMIGIHGVGGVGKTTLAKEVCARALEELFDDVIMISVSRFPNLRRVKAEIAAFLGLEIDAEEVPRVASQRQHQRSRNAKLLIILDDVWQKLDLHAVGIPFGDESQGCKLLVSSRSKDVLSSEMGSQKNFLVDVLSGEDWSLFQTIVEDPRVNVEIVKICSGLPLLIVLVSLQIKYKAWSDILKQLPLFRNEDLCERVHEVVESSFTYLPGQQLQSVFLLCASFSHPNIQIQHLLIYIMGLRIFDFANTIEGVRRGLSFFINELKKVGFLQDGDLDGYVKMHDMVRDSAISIASKFENWIIVKLCNIQDLPASLQCPKAELFVLSCQDLCLEIPDLFFEGIPKLKVVDFTGIHFVTKLPSSIGCLRNLDSLCFHRCWLDNISGIGELTGLKFLSFADSDIVELPREIGALTQLKLLDLTNCSKLQVIPTNVISKLSSLEDLCMHNSYVRWDEEGNLSLAELEKLSCLSSLEIQIINPKLILKFSSFYYGLWRYKIIIGEQQEGRWKNYERLRMLKLIKIEESFRLEDAVEVLLRGTEDLYIDEVSGMGSVLDVLIGEGFPLLKHLCIKNDYGIQHLIKSTTASSCDAFPVLESLSLHNLNNLEMICDGPLKNGSFGILRILRISHCSRLKSLFSNSSCGCLWKLEEIEVESCENMETLYSEGIEDIDFPRLTSMKLKNLPRFKGFCIEKEKREQIALLFHDTSSQRLFAENVIFYDLDGKRFPRLTHLHIRNCYGIQHTYYLNGLNSLKSLYFEKLRSLNASNCNKLRTLFSFSTTNCSRKLLELEVQSCRNMEAIVGGRNEDEILELTHLRSLKLENLPNLIGFCERKWGTGQPELLFNKMVSFPNLTSIVVVKCNNLKYIFTTSMVTCLVQLKKLEISNCELVEAIMQSNKTKESKEDIIKKIVFPKLDSLSLSGLPKVKMFGFGYKIEFPFLRELSIECPAMENFVSKFSYRSDNCNRGQHLFNEMVTFSNLESLTVSNMNTFRYLWHEKFLLDDLFSKLKSLNIANCSRLSVVFPVDAYRRIQKLEALYLSCCDGIKEIFPFEETECGEIYIAEEFALRDVLIVDLASLKYVFPNTMTYSLLKLEQLAIHDCNLQVIFFEVEKDEKSQGITCLEDASLQQVEMLQEMEDFSTEKVIEFPQLYSLKLKNLPNLAGFCNKGEKGLGMQVSLPSLKCLELCECKNLKYVFTSTMASLFMQLEKLEINNCELVEEILSSRQFHEIDDIESFEKIMFPKLEYLSQGITSLEDASLQQVEMLQETEEYSNKGVMKFPLLCSLKLKNVHVTGFCNNGEQGFDMQVSFPRLKSLELCGCKNFKYVFTAKMVNCLMQLEKLEIINCELVEEIILSTQFDEIEDLKSIVKIVFPKLKYLSLEELPNLKTFAFGYQVELKALKELSISYCPVLMNFVPKYLCIESDEYLFNEMVTFSELERIEVSHTNSFKYIWDGQSIADDSFLKLKSLRIEYCSKLTVVFPSNIYKRFQALETLYLCCCSRVEEIYRYEWNNFEELNTVEPFYLQNLEIRNLPSLKYIWSKDPPGASTFEYLRCVKVVSCKDLMFVFPKSIARRLFQLQCLRVGNSHMEVVIANTNAEESIFVVPQLTVLQLENLNQMRNLCEGPCTFKCPKLKQFDIYGCYLVMNYRSKIKSSQLCGFDQVMKLGSEMSAYQEEKSPFFVKKEFYSNLEDLTFDDQGLKLMLSPELGVEFSKLKRVTIRSLEVDSAPLLSSFLRRFSVEKLVFVESYVEEIFLSDDDEAFQTLEHLELVGDDNLKHILKEGYGFGSILRNLLTLNVEFCESLINIAPSLADFTSLTSLEISVCPSMMYLVTASAAKTMVNLIELKISGCSMMEVIVEDGHMVYRSIVFYKLKCLELCDLPTLKGFSSGISVFNFPLLEQVVVKKCFAMKNFCDGQVLTPELEAIQFQDRNNWEGDLNATIASHAKSRETYTNKWAA